MKSHRNHCSAGCRTTTLHRSYRVASSIWQYSIRMLLGDSACNAGLGRIQTSWPSCHASAGLSNGRSRRCWRYCELVPRASQQRTQLDGGLPHAPSNDSWGRARLGLWKLDPWIHAGAVFFALPADPALTSLCLPHTGWSISSSRIALFYCHFAMPLPTSMHVVFAPSLAT
jgi:hypothetical protein